MSINMKKIFSFILINFLITASGAQDTNFINSKVAIFQSKVQREIEKSADVYSELLYPSNDYIERFLFFILDSSGKEIEKYSFIDAYGKEDSTIKNTNVANFVTYWKDFLPLMNNYSKVKFVQPILIRKRDRPNRPINSIPIFSLNTDMYSLTQFILLPQISIWVGQSVR